MNPPPIVEGNEHARHYKDMLGQKLQVGDLFVHSSARSSSVSTHIYKVVSFVDLSYPATLGRTPDGRVVQSWDTAFKVKAIRMHVDRVMGAISLPPVWVSGRGSLNGSFENLPEDQHKPSTISAVERIVRVDPDV